jgi:predicted phosphodiesterase
VRRNLSLLAAGLVLALVGAGCLHPGAATPPPPTPFHFTVTSDVHLKTETYGKVLDAMAAKSGGQGAFQICIGDVVDAAGQSPDKVRAVVDAKFGPQARWYAVVGNHDTKSEPALQWRRDEFNKGSGGRPPLKSTIKNPGPTGGEETTYSFDYGNAHFVILNEYYNGKADTGTDGDIVPALLKWLEADLAANARPMVFVFGHEPAFVETRHVGASLDGHAANRDAFWKVLVKYKVQAFFSGHIHYYYKEVHDGVVQISDGNAGNGKDPKYQTYLDVLVGADKAEVRVWQSDADGGTTWKLLETYTLGDLKSDPTVKPVTPAVREKTSAAPAAATPRAKAA